MTNLLLFPFSIARLDTMKTIMMMHMRLRVKKVFMMLAGVSLLVVVKMMMAEALLTMVLSVVMLAVMVVVLVLISDCGRNDSFQFSPPIS